MCVVLWPRLAQENFSADPLADLLYDVPAHGSSHFQNNEISIGQRVENKHSAPLWKYFARPEAKLTTPIEFTFQWCACRQLWVRAAPIFFCWLSIAIRPQWYSAWCGFTYGRHDHLVACWYSSSIPTQRQPERRARGALSSSRCSHYILPFDASSGRTDPSLENANIILF